jgi:AbrB family looped-hinge helix DNA binding protein
MAFLSTKCHCIITLVTTTLTLDKAGRVVLPKPVRDEMQLRAGDSLELESSEDRIVLRPRRGGTGLHKKQGIWVFSTGEPISAEATDETLREMRRERELSFLGNRAAPSPRRKKAR